MDEKNIQLMGIVKLKLDEEKQIEAKMMKLIYDRGEKNSFSLHGQQEVECSDKSVWKVKMFVEVEKV